MKLSEEALVLLNQLEGSRDDVINQLKTMEIDDLSDLMYADMECIIQECISYLEQSDNDFELTLPESSLT